MFSWMGVHGKEEILYYTGKNVSLYNYSNEGGANG
jgi:hypothetical protein